MTEPSPKQDQPPLIRLLTVDEARRALGIGRTATLERLDLNEDGEAVGGPILSLIEEMACALNEMDRRVGE